MPILKGRPRKRQWFLAGLSVFIFCTEIDASNPQSDRTNRIPSTSSAASHVDRANPLWREEYFFTGEQRGPKTKDSLEPKRPGRPKSTRTPREIPSPQSFLHGGELTSLPDEYHSPPHLVERFFQGRKNPGEIIVDLGEPIEEDPGMELTKKRPTAFVFQSRNLTSTQNQMIASEDDVAVHQTRQLALRPDPSMVQGHRNMELSVSVGPSSLFRISQTFFEASLGTVSAFGATLRLLAPMIVARRVLSTIGYVGYDYYNGRYLRTTYTKRLAHMQQYEIISATRACGRIIVQLVSMWIMGSASRMILDRMPCFMPDVACRYWFGLIWVLSVLGGANLASIWTQRYSILQIQTVAESDYSLSPPTYFFTRPWHILQWMKDPETWLLNLTRLQRHPNHPHRRQNVPPFAPDALLFPSTWRPLHVLSTLAVVHAIAQSLKHSNLAAMRIMMQDYCFALAIYDEWKRVFLLEQRVALGVVVSALSFAALCVLAASAAMEVGWIAAFSMIPLLFASLVSGWMNTVLCSERHFAQGY